MLEQHGPASWDGLVEASAFGKVQDRVLVRLREMRYPLDRNQRVRLLNVLVAPPPEDEPEAPLVVTEGASSEAFVAAHAAGDGTN